VAFENKKSQLWMDFHISAQTKNIIRAHFVELAERFQMT